MMFTLFRLARFSLESFCNCFVKYAFQRSYGIQFNRSTVLLSQTVDEDSNFIYSSVNYYFLPFSEEIH